MKRVDMAGRRSRHRVGGDFYTELIYSDTYNLILRWPQAALTLLRMNPEKRDYAQRVAVGRDILADLDEYFGDAR